MWLILQNVKFCIFAARVPYAYVIPEGNVRSLVVAKYTSERHRYRRFFTATVVLYPVLNHVWGQSDKVDKVAFWRPVYCPSHIVIDWCWWTKQREYVSGKFNFTNLMYANMFFIQHIPNVSTIFPGFYDTSSVLGVNGVSWLKTELPATEDHDWWCKAVQYTNSFVYSVSQKNPPLRFSEIFFPNGWEFLTNFYTPIIRSFLD